MHKNKNQSNEVYFFFSNLKQTVYMFWFVCYSGCCLRFHSTMTRSYGDVTMVGDSLQK